MIMVATVIRIDARGLLVRDMETGQDVFVNFLGAASFRPGDVVQITYTGTMTASIPPQISATSVVLLSSVAQPQPTFSEIRRAVILQVRRDVLIVRDPARNNRLVTVNYPYAHHFCVGNRVNIRYETAFINGGLTINATDIFPAC